MARAAHSPFNFPHFHCFCGSNSMGGGADGDSFGNWLRNFKYPAYGFRNDASLDAGDNNTGNRNGHVSLHFL